MKYMGSKARFGKDILAVISPYISETLNYVEPFAGGMNMMQFVPNTWNRYANDSNKYLMVMWYMLVHKGWVPPEQVTKEFYESCKRLEQPDHVVGYVGINCSYSGKWFGGYAGKTETKDGTIRDYQSEAFNHVMKQKDTLSGVKMVSKSYTDLAIPTKSLIYCDPPYANTTGYKDDFDHEAFWCWCRDAIPNGHTVFVSEYTAPDDFICVWEKSTKSSLSANGTSGGNKVSIERLFMHESQVTK